MVEYNIYYLEDKEKHFVKIKSRFNNIVNVFPKKKNWPVELELFKSYVEQRDHTTKNEIEALLNKMDLLILDQQLDNLSHSASIIYDCIIYKNQKFNDLKVIIISGADEPQRGPKYYATKNLEMISKEGNLYDVGDKVWDQIKKMLNIDEEAIIKMCDEKNRDKERKAEEKRKREISRKEEPLKDLLKKIKK